MEPIVCREHSLVTDMRACCYTGSLQSTVRRHDPSVKNFLKTAAHQHKDPQVRLEFVQQLDASASEAQATLASMVRQDGDLHVRLAAIAKSDELMLLRELLDANGDDAGHIIEAAEKRLVHMLSNGDISDIAARALLASHAARLAAPMATYSSAPEQRNMALQSLEEESSMMSVVQQSRFHDTRMAAADRLSQHDSLRAALVSVRSKDKEVAKLLQHKLDAAAAEEAALIARRYAVSTALKSAEDLADGVWTPHHAGRLQAAQEKWAALPAEDRAADEADFAKAVGIAEARFQEYTRVQARRSEQEAVPDRTDTNASTALAAEPDNKPEKSVAEAVIEPIVDSALEPVLQPLKACSIADLPEQLSQLRSAVEAGTLAGSEHVTQVFAYGQSVAVMFDPPYELNKARPGMLQQRIKRVTALLDLDTVMPGFDLGSHLFVGELNQHLKALEDRLGKAQQESSDRIKATHRQFAALAGIVKEGKWGPANSMLRRLQKKLDAMETAERVSLNDKLTRAEKQIDEMADWQDFAARPKLEALCDSMEGLPAKELAPEALAKQVKQLQASWKSLGVSRASNELWTRFKTAGDTAYEPCKAWFDAKQKERQLKLDAKVELCVQLEQQHSNLSDGEGIDWKAQVRLVSHAKRDWSRNRVTDRKPDKSIEARFSAALLPIEQALAEQYDANAKAKQALIDKVETLASNDITQHSANQAKSLLSAWKLVGVMRRKEDQALWQTFNGHLGTIFKHQHKVEREKQRAGLEHVFRAKDIIKQLKQMSRSDAPDESQLQKLTSEFHQLAEFPERDKKFLIRDFRQAQDACSRAQDNASKRRNQANQGELLRLSALCEQLERAVEDPSSAVDTLEEDILHSWDASDVRLPNEATKPLTKRRDAALTHMKNGTHPDYEANESHRRDLLIRMEIAAGVDTPAEDKSRRMKYQLENLQQGMTSAGIDDAKATLAQLGKQWMAAGPVKSAVVDGLNSRYLKSCKR